MPPLLTLLLLIVAGVMFTLAACSVPTGRLNTIGAGLLCVLVAVWLGPALTAL
jgi:hypothetical protein